MVDERCSPTARRPRLLSTKPALEDLGDQEVARQGREFSWWHTWVVGNGATPIVAGVVSANRFKSWLSAGKRDGVLTMRLHQIGRDEAIELAPGAELQGEPSLFKPENSRTHFSDTLATSPREKIPLPVKHRAAGTPGTSSGIASTQGQSPKTRILSRVSGTLRATKRHSLSSMMAGRKLGGSGSPIAALRVA